MNDIRPSKLERVFCELDLIKCFATCQRLKTASVITDMDFTILLTSRNGTPINSPHCNELTTPDERCNFCLHAEKNLINFAAKYGIRTEGLTVVTLYRPCIGCANDLVQAGISAIYYRYDYDTDGQKDYVLRLFRNNNIYYEQTPISTHEMTLVGFLEIWMDTWKK